MTAATDDKPARSQAERAAGSLLRRYSVEPTDANLATFAAYRARTRRARWFGVLGAVIVGAAGSARPTRAAIWSSPGCSLATWQVRLPRNCFRRNGAPRALSARRP